MSEVPLQCDPSGTRQVKLVDVAEMEYTSHDRSSPVPHLSASLSFFFITLEPRVG